MSFHTLIWLSAADRYSEWKAVIIGNIQLLSLSANPIDLNKLYFDMAFSQATAALQTADSSVYDGVEKTALIQTINKYVSFSSTDTSAYEVATNELKLATTAMLAYKTMVETYVANLAVAQGYLATYLGTKYAKLESYQKLQSILMVYGKASIFDSATLKSTSDSLGYYNAIFAYMQGAGVNVLTDRIQRAQRLI
jgi:hypothetical protein